MNITQWIWTQLHFCVSHKENSQIQHDNLVQEAQEVQVAHWVQWVQADRPVQAVLGILVNQDLLELPAGWWQEQCSECINKNKNKCIYSKVHVNMLSLCWRFESHLCRAFITSTSNSCIQQDSEYGNCTNSHAHFSGTKSRWMLNHTITSTQIKL